MHVASAKPKYLAKDGRARRQAGRGARDRQDAHDGRPEERQQAREILDKIIEGGVGTFYKEQVLLEQPYVREPKQTIAQLIKGKAEIKRFVRFEVGEAAA